MILLSSVSPLDEIQYNDSGLLKIQLKLGKNDEKEPNFLKNFLKIEVRKD